MKHVVCFALIFLAGLSSACGQVVSLSCDRNGIEDVCQLADGRVNVTISTHDHYSSLWFKSMAAYQAWEIKVQAKVDAAIARDEVETKKQLEKAQQEVNKTGRMKDTDDPAWGWHSKTLCEEHKLVWKDDLCHSK